MFQQWPIDNDQFDGCGFDSYRGEIPPILHIEYVGTYAYATALLYQPNTIISGTILPDLSGNHYDGSITWGTYPTNVATTIASGSGGTGGGTGLYPSGGTGNLVAPNQNSNGLDIAPAIGGQNEQTGVPANAFTTLIHALSGVISLAGSPYTLPEQIIWLILATMLILGAMTLSLMYLPNQLIGGVVCIGLSIVFWKMTIYPFVMVLFVVVGCISIIIYERKPSV